MSALSKLISKISLFMATLTVTAIAITMILQVFFRKFLGRPLSWSDEFAGYMLVWLALFGAVWALQEKRHIAIDALTTRLKSPVSEIVSIIANISILIFVLVLLWYGTPLVLKLSGTYAVSLPVPKTVIYSVIPITSAFSIIILINSVINDLKSIFKNKEVKAQ